MKTNIVKSTLFLSAMIMLGACNQDPYPAGNLLTVKQTSHTVDPVLSVDVPDNMSCSEGQLCTATFQGHVSKGNPVLEFENLPDGAKFDPATNTLSYTPDYTVVDPSESANTDKFFPVDVMVYSDQDPTQSNTEHFNIMVTNTTRPTTITLVSGTSTDIAEEDSIDQVVNVANPDFPNGPFYLSLNGAPDGATVTPVDGNPSQFNIHFLAPNANYVTVNDTQNDAGVFQKKFNITYTASPVKLSIPGLFYQTWTVSDSRHAPQVLAPDAITQGSIVNFGITANDLNEEIAPVITVDQATIPFGKLTITPLTMTTNSGVSQYSSAVNVKWDGITPDHLDGKAYPIFFVVCVDSAKSSATYCTNKKTMVTLSATKN